MDLIQLKKLFAKSQLDGSNETTLIPHQKQ
jgi:hypothetical protein